MKPTRRFILALALGMSAILALHAWLQVRRELALFDSDMRADARSMGQAMAPLFLRILEMEGMDSALAVIRRASTGNGPLVIRWVWIDHLPGVAIGPRIPRAELTPLFAGEVVTKVDAKESERILCTYVPVRLPGGPLGAIEISESMRAEEAYIATTVRNAVLATLALVAVTAALATFLGALLVGRPAHLLADKARRVGSGDLAGPLVMRHDDELALVAREMNAMCQRLVEANDGLRRETEARLNAIEQLRHADRLLTVGKLASGIAHELGTPLNVIAGRAQMIVEGEVPAEEVSENARIIVEQSQRMTTIIRQLLDFARRREVRKAPASLEGLATRTIAMLAPIAAKRGVKVELCSEAELPAVQVDEGQIQQALTNLVVNAVQATPAGGSATVSLGTRIATPPPEMAAAGGSAELESPQARAFAFVDVIDTGCGMDDDVRRHIFEPFFTTKPPGEGTGLGLSVTYGIVREHGGFIAVTSAPGRGSHFSVYLPLASPDAHGGSEEVA